MQLPQFMLSPFDTDTQLTKRLHAFLREQRNRFAERDSQRFASHMYAVLRYTGYLIIISTRYHSTCLDLQNLERRIDAEMPQTGMLSQKQVELSTDYNRVQSTVTLD